MKIYSVSHTVLNYEREVKMKSYLLFLPDLYKNLGPEKTGILYKDGNLRLNYINNKDIISIDLLTSKNCSKDKRKLKSVLKKIEKIKNEEKPVKGIIKYFEKEFLESINDIMKGE